MPASAQTSPALSITGQVNSPRSFTLAELEKLPWTTVEASYDTERGPARASHLVLSGSPRNCDFADVVDIGVQ